MPKNKSKKSVRLPSHISPNSYKLTIKPDLESCTFSGNEIIKIKIEKEVNKITLHSKDIDIETASVGIGNKKQFTSKIIYDDINETATLFFKNKINGISELHLSFVGIIKDNLRGLYRSKYVLDGEEKYLATTQFEATDARRAFPCFDEPAHKATFEVSLIVSEKHTAISNTLPATSVEHSSGYKIVSFAPSPKMSTYLLAFIVGEFEYIEGKTKDNTQVRVFTTIGKKHQSKFALDIAIKSLEFYNEYFDIPYPLPTLDLIAIPDFEAAAMENWGAVTFRETAILVDEEHTSLQNKQWIAITISHELAHQWFGNLVTMHWWTDLWLNEGFASYMESLCLDKIFPEWNIWELFLANARYKSAMQIDSLKGTHPIEVEVHHPDEISEVFDMVSYEKGSAIIRMLADYIGEDKFKEGLRHYLKKHSYKNTKTTDLWESFEKVSKKPVGKIMNSWTSQAGFPLVKLSIDSKNNLKLTQERFFLSRISRKENNKKNLWQIPVIYKINNIEKKILIDKKTINIKDTSIGKINTNEISFARTCYNQENIEYIKKEILANKLNSIDRLGVLRDFFFLAEGGYIPTDQALDFSLNYVNEKEYTVWVELSSGLNKIYNLIKKEEFKEKYNNYALTLFSPLAKNLNFEKQKNENQANILLRNLAISQAAFYGDKKIIKEAQNIFNNKDKKPIDPDIRAVIYNIVAQNGKIKEWNLLVDMYTKNKLHEEKDRILRAMAQFRNKELLEKTIHFAMSSEVRDQDAVFVLAIAWQGEYGQDLVWDYLKNNWDKILEKYGEGGSFLSKLLEFLGGHTSLKDLKEAQKFFAKNSTPGAERTLLQSYEKIASNAAWLKDDKKLIKNWLNKNY